MLPRVSYLPLITDKVKVSENMILLQIFVSQINIFISSKQVKKHFNRFIEKDDDEVWFSYNEIPLKW